MFDSIVGSTNLSLMRDYVTTLPSDSTVIRCSCQGSMAASQDNAFASLRREGGKKVDAVLAALQKQGDRPNALRMPDWCSFGDTLAKDAKMRNIIGHDHVLKRAIKNHGKILGLWKRLFPEAADWLAQRKYGPPASNLRGVALERWLQSVQHHPPAPAESYSYSYSYYEDSDSESDSDPSGEDLPQPQGPGGSWIPTKVAGCASDSECDEAFRRPPTPPPPPRRRRRSLSCPY